MIKLTMKEALPKIREAFDKGELQIQQPGFSEGEQQPVYAGPCAIGAALPPEVRVAFDNVRDEDGDNYLPVYSLIEEGHLTVSPKEQEDFESLQSAHDWANLESFEHTLKSLEKEYL